MKRKERFDQLLEVAKELFDRVEMTVGDFRGGVCNVRSERHLILNRGASLDVNLRILANALAATDTEGRYLLPAVRESIELYADQGMGLREEP